MANHALRIGLVDSLIKVRSLLIDLANNPAFEDDAPEFNAGGVGRVASCTLGRWITALDRPEIREAVKELETQYCDAFAEAGTQTGWGTEMVTKDQWIDVTKPHKTRKGQRVVGLYIDLHDDNGDEVTYPVKGSIVVRERPERLEYCIWTLKGEKWVGSESPGDLVPVEEEST